ncbi:MAG: hypothetical protein AUI14_09360 [Actinobacteria bacterium 13_2_20CM_2_71_6]|nr:MAG: hypothetical protein AUI14_09360 [Actinobacteria bacterium 13_2_20CM_2_71_6]
MTLATRRDLRALFAPRSVAVVGASDDPGKYGNWIAVRALRGSRPVHLVNRSRDTVLGRPASPDLASVGEPVDLAVIAVPAKGFEAAVDDALAAGVRAIVGISAGLDRQAAIAARVRAAGACLLGPNCLGVLDHTTGLELTSFDFPPGEVALISQSGNIAIELAGLLADHGLGFARFASLGNQADLDAADLLDACVDHDGTAAIALYCEDFRDGRRFVRAAQRAYLAGKPVVLLAVGRGTASVRGARSHTGALVTPAGVVTAACAAAGIESVATPTEMSHLLQGLLRSRPPRGRRVAVFADGGGQAQVASDCLEAAGLAVPRFGPALAASVAAELPATAAAENPVDVAGGGEQDIACFQRVSAHLVGSDEVDAVLMTGFFGGYGEYSAALGAGEIVAAQAIARLVRDRAATFVVHTMNWNSVAAGVLRTGGVPVYRQVEDAVWTFEVSTVDELYVAAGALRFPLVLKALGDEHKSDRGGVVLGIASPTALLAAWEDVQARLRPPSCSVEEMADLSHAVELIVGVRQDPRFGPVVLVGMGGVPAEVLRDTRCALGPVDATTARSLLLSLRGAPLLTGVRGRPGVDLDAVADLVATLSYLGAAHPELAEIECNPVAARPDGAVCLDARIVPQPSAVPLS